MNAIRIKSLITASVFTAMTVIICSLLSPSTAHADLGPKPTVNITVENVGDRVCYGTLLSEYDSTGPQSAWKGGDEDDIYTDLDRDIWKAFVDYEDADGYWFLQVAWLCDDAHGIDWNYFPPYSFKVLLYFPETNAFAVSGIYERYAFNSHFTVTLSGEQITVERAEAITAKKSYDYGGEILNLFLRIIITIAIELCVALLFRFTQKRLLLAVLCVNAVTQIILNIFLNVVYFHNGMLVLIGAYVLGELVVFVLEATAYSVVFGNTRFNGNGLINVSKFKSVAYAFVANAASFMTGFGVFLIGAKFA